MKKRIITIVMCMFLLAAVFTAVQANNEQIRQENSLGGVPLNTEIIAVYLLDEGQGTIAHDSSENQLHGNIENPLWTDGAGYNGSALGFSKSENRYVTVDDNVLFDLDTFSISALFKPESDFTFWPRGYATIVSKEYQYILRFANNYDDGRAAVSAIYFVDRDIFAHRAVTVFFDEIDPALWPTVGEWNSIQMIYDGEYLSLFINDNLLGEIYSPASMYPPHFSDANLLIGNHQMFAGSPPASSEDEFIGSIDFIEINGEANHNNSLAPPVKSKTFVCGILHENRVTNQAKGVLHYRVIGARKTGWINLDDIPEQKNDLVIKAIRIGPIKVICNVIEDFKLP